MSSARCVEGAGSVTWWGFSPARDLTAKGPVKQQGELNVLLVGSSDPRHILKTFAGLEDTDSLHVWVIENSMDVIARQLLLLSLSLAPEESTSVHKKAETFLEVLGNSELRSETGDALREAAARLVDYVTVGQEAEPHPCLDTSLLKFRERDELVRIFRTWAKPCTEGSGSVSITRAWDARVRQHLGTRYDSRRGCFDWDLAMKLHQRGAGVINKQQYFEWRSQGVAFQMREGVYQTTNPTLLSYRILRHRGDKVAVAGYWGDIVSSPYLCFGVETSDQSLLKTENGSHVKTAQDISFANVQALLQALSSRGQRPEETLVNTPTPGLLLPTGLSVTFLPLDALSRLPDKKSFSHFFHCIYLSAGMAHQLGCPLQQMCSPGGVLVVELARFLLDLSADQERGFVETVVEGAKDAGFDPWTPADPDPTHAVFTPQSPPALPLQEGHTTGTTSP
ncbi:dynein axonemal assembly factor 3-like [Gadus chalcogrammus]|uniref:dynein axonemal assembly factor 3-like n=1 Tax=Gadus chalcogrammus TaxID=1042646 RepID=UPI0024C4E2A9|nr:dynein axonemal assembly factor 3-like [Gadus chalcogrammus]